MALSQIRIVRITLSRVPIEIFRSRLVERRIKVYAFDKIGIGDVISTEGDKVPGPFVDEVSAMVGVNADVKNEGSGVEMTEVMNDGVSAHMFNRRPRQVRHLPH